MPPDRPRASLAGRIRNSQFVDYIWRAFRSAAYPLQGIWYFSKQGKFWPLWAGRLLPLSLVSLTVYLILFLFAYLPQVAFLAIWQGRGAWFSAMVLTLGEGLVLIQALFEGFFVDEARVDVFDATLIDHGLVDLVAPHRLLFPDAPNSVKMLGKPTSRAEYSPWSFTQIFELVVCLPLTFIPVVGAPAYIIITGTRLGKLSHHRWFKLRGLSRRERKEEAKKYSWDYVWFGTMAMILELVPLLSFFFLLTTTAGCGLWVSKLENKTRGRPREEGARAEEGRAGPPEASERTEVAEEERDEPPPPYSDDPI
ncbi:hypothetical protein N8I77_003738 [Diaporthe amygdali]|uniref:Uncharacterized protein n=1 Tax=Phomopsis amygdali TaxID=1214568 RepID=A0AAD9SJJ8_PHOAM|nr:hypothetical protein N8I77_003738 [Diaporthe amygdali]KAK2610292.1 hypothetical protein N8I77_003738 [Diaporthe amygdali]